MASARMSVAGLKVTVPLDAAALPAGLVPAEGPAGDPILEIVLEGSSLELRAKLNGKNYRKLLKQVGEHGAEKMAVALQGVLRAPGVAGGPFILEGAGIQAVVKAPRATGPGGSAGDGGA